MKRRLLSSDDVEWSAVPVGELFEEGVSSRNELDVEELEMERSRWGQVSSNQLVVEDTEEDEDRPFSG